MLSWSLTFFVIALIAAAMGFRGIAGLSAEVGWLFAVLAIVFLPVGTLGSMIGGRPPSSLP